MQRAGLAIRLRRASRRDRVLGNPRFLLVLFIELAMGISAKTTAEYKQRGDNFFKASASPPHPPPPPPGWLVHCRELWVSVVRWSCTAE